MTPPCSPAHPAGVGSSVVSAFDGSTREDHPPRFAVGVVGAGRVGAVLGAALHRAGHEVTAVSEESRARAADLLPGVPVRDVPEVVTEVDLVLLAVPDDTLPSLVSGLAKV